MQDDRRATLRSCFIPVLIYAPAILALARGYYRELGLEVELERLEAGTDLVPGTLSGHFDVTVGGAGAELFSALAAGHDLRLLAPFHFEHPPATTPLMVRSDLYASGAVRTVEDLRGRIVAAPSRSAPLFWLQAALESGGLTVRDVDLRFVGYHDVAPAFEASAVDAALIGEPIVTELIERGIAVRLTDDFVDGLQPTYLFCLRSTLNERRDAVVRFVAAMLRTYADLESDDPKRNWDATDTSEVVAAVTNVPSNRVPPAMRPHYDPLGRFQPESIQRLYRFFVDYNYVDPIPGFSPDALFESDVVTEALALLPKDGS